MTVERNYAIGLKISHQFFNQWEAKPNQSHLACTRYFSCALNKLQVIADWFIALLACNWSEYVFIAFSTIFFRLLENRAIEI